MKRVPPRIRIFSGFGFFAAQAGSERASGAGGGEREQGAAFHVMLLDLLRAGRGVVRDPVAHGLVPEQRVLRLQHPVVLVREIHQLRWARRASAAC